MERQKGIKFFECIGDPPITGYTTDNIKITRDDFIETGKMNMRERDIHRFQLSTDEDRVVVPTDT